MLTCCAANSLVRAADAMALTQSEVGLVHRPDVGLCRHDDIVTAFLAAHPPPASRET